MSETIRKNGGLRKLPRLCKNALESRSAVFNARSIAANRETHLRRRPLNSQLRQQGHEVGVCPVVVNNESCVDLIVAPVQIKFHSVAVASDLSLGFKERHVLFVTQ